MKSIYTLLYTFLLVSLLMPLSLYAQKEVGQSADSAYAAADYAKAITRYQDLIASQAQPTAQQFYNLGCAYYKSGNIPQAVLNFSRAYRLDPTDSDIRFNLDLAKSKTPDKMKVLSNGFISPLLLSISHTFSYNEWMIMGVICFLLLIIGLLIYRFHEGRKWRIFGFYLALVTLLVTLFANLLAYQSYHFTYDDSKAILTASEITIKSSPDLSAETIAVVHGGIEVTTTQALSGYYEVKLPDGTIGWVPESDLTMIYPFTK